MRTRSMRRPGALAGALLFALLSIVASCGGGKRTDDSSQSDRNAGAKPDSVEAPLGRVDSTVVLESLTGERVPMSALRGKIVVVSFWATWNNNSVETLAIMDALAKRYRHFRFLAVAMDEGGAQTVRAFTVSHPIVSEVFVNGREVARAFGGVGKLPVTIVILRDGRILRRFEGFQRSEKYESLLRGIIRRRL
jgi:thiol-disulfide isomerase/thioredoxin